MSNGYTHKKIHIKGKYEYCFQVNHCGYLCTTTRVLVFTCVVAVGCNVRMLAALIVALLEG